MGDVRRLFCSSKQKTATKRPLLIGGEGEIRPRPLERILAKRKGIVERSGDYGTEPIDGEAKPLKKWSPKT
jgi:hypothetical protein